MTLNEALALLQKVHNGTDERYLDDISERIGEYSLGIKRKSSENIAVMAMFCGEGELREFKDCSFFYLAENGYSKPYPFECADFLADDWECGFVDLEGDYNKVKMRQFGWTSFSEFLTEKYDELLDYDSAVEKVKELFSSVSGALIQSVNIEAIFSDLDDDIHMRRMDLFGGTDGVIKDWHILDSLEKLGFGKGDMFEITIYFKDGKEVNLAEWEVLDE